MRRGSLRRALALAFRRTPHGPRQRLILYEKDGCGLCAETFRTLTRLALELPLEIVRVDIARDPALVDRYVLRVPVISVDGRELDAAGADEVALGRFVRGG